MANDDLGVGRPASPPVTTPSGTGELGNVTTGTTSAPPPVDAPATTASGTPGLNGSVGPTLASPQRLNPADLMTLLYALQRKVKEGHVSDAETNIKMRADSKRSKNADLIDKLKKIAHSKPNKLGSIFAKVFAWIGVALAFVVAGVVAAVSGGSAATPLLILATIALAVLIAQETGGTDKMMDAMHMDDRSKMIFSMCVTVAILVLNIGATVASGGAEAVSSVVSAVTGLLKDAGEAAIEGGAVAAEAAGEGAAAASEGAAAASEGAATATEGAAEAGEATSAVSKSSTFMKNANRLRASAQVLSGATMVAGGGIGIDTAKKEYEGTIAHSDAMRDRAELAKLAALDEDDMRRIRKLIEQLQRSSVMALETLSSADETATKIRTSV